MNPSRVLFPLALVCATAVVTKTVVSQDENKDDKAAAAAWEKYAKTTAKHKNLEPTVGKWDLTIKYTSGEEWYGISTKQWVLGGRFVHEYMTEPTDPNAKKGTKRYQSISFVGFDNLKQKYVSIGMDTDGTGANRSYGSCDDTGKVFTLTGEYDDPATKKKTKTKSIVHVTSKDEHTIESWEDYGDGKEYKIYEATYTRKAAEQK